MAGAGWWRGSSGAEWTTAIVWGCHHARDSQATAVRACCRLFAIGRHKGAVDCRDTLLGVSRTSKHEAFYSKQVISLALFTIAAVACQANSDY